MRRKLIIPALALLLVLGITSPVLAVEDEAVKDRKTIGVEDENDQSVEAEVNIEPGDDMETRLQRQEDRIKERREKLEAKIEERRSARKERLEGVRLARCENREQRINQHLDRSVDNATRHLQVIQKIEEGIKKFYTDKSLTAEGYDAALATADEKEADAIAALEVLKEVEFDCSSADAEKPADAIKNIVHERHDALKAYRTAVKDLLLVVKKSLNDSKTTDDTGGEA
jgi:hypothetical protein